MEDCLKTDINCPKDAKNWIYTILNGYHYKKDITNQVQPNLMTNSVWQYIRRWLLANGVQDDPNCQFTRYSIPDDKKEYFEKISDNETKRYRIQKKAKEWRSNSRMVRF